MEIIGAIRTIGLATIQNIRVRIVQVRLSVNMKSIAYSFAGNLLC
jgi:hypothetical protein